MLFINNNNALDKYKMSKLALLLILFFNLFQSSALAGEVNFSLLPTSSDVKVQPIDLAVSTWVIPIPNSLIQQYSTITLVDGSNKIIQASFNTALLWPDENEQQYIRSLIVSTDKSHLINANSSYSLKWQNNSTGKIQHSKSVLNITHHAKLSSSWLALSFYAPLKTIAQNRFTLGLINLTNAMEDLLLSRI